MNLQVKNERDGVLSILLFVNEEKGFLDEGIEKVIGAGCLVRNPAGHGPTRPWNNQERRLITRLAKGTIERQIFVDVRINEAASIPVYQMNPAVQNILRLSVYSLYYMGQIPAHAAVSEAVNLARLRAPKGLSGFVNGVLRGVISRMEQETDAEQTDAGKAAGDADAGKAAGVNGSRWSIIDPAVTVGSKKWVRQASVCYSVPKWIIKLWLADYGPSVTHEILEGLMAEQNTLTARVNRTKTTRDDLLKRWKEAGIICRADSSLPAVIFTPDRPIRELPGYKEGYFYIQDAGSMTAGEAAPVRSGDQVLDLCAAPGGKTTQMAERLVMAGQTAIVGRSAKAKQTADRSGRVLACDIRTGKIPVMQENAQRLGLTNIDFKVADATEYNPVWEGQWDVVMADVPCSGLGVMAHKPDIKLRLKPEDIDALAAVQRAILENAVRYTKPGGYLVYSTCTVCRAENDGQIEKIMSRHPELRLISPRCISGKGCDFDEHEPQMIQLFPQKGHDGFFVALLRKEK